MKMHPNVYLQHNKGFISLGYSFMALSGHCWVHNGHCSAFPASRRSKIIILNDIKMDKTASKLYLYIVLDIKKDADSSVIPLWPFQANILSTMAFFQNSTKLFAIKYFKQGWI